MVKILFIILTLSILLTDTIPVIRVVLANVMGVGFVIAAVLFVFMFIVTPIIDIINKK